MKFAKFLYLFFLLILCFNSAKTEEKVVIELQIGSEILTNVDFVNEQNYLIALNNNLKNIPKNQLKQIARDSLIKEKIKKIELEKYFNFNQSNTEKYTEEILQDYYKRLNFNNKDEFNNYLLNFNLNIEGIKQKLKIETLWNKLIYNKFNHQVNIDEEKMKKKLINQKNLIIQYDLSEILFELNTNENLSNKYKLILNNIKENGFENSANIFSISDSSKFGGKIGIINQNQLNDILIKEIELLKIGELTKPIQMSGGYLIIRLNNKKEKEVKLDLKKALKQKVTVEKNRQLNQFSLIYYNKIKQNLFISEK